jgi:hypothetical protein
VLADDGANLVTGADDEEETLRSSSDRGFAGGGLSGRLRYIFKQRRR